jgi:hypothetical protein
MPKISNNRIGVGNNATEAFYDVPVYYNQARHFYCEIPKDFNESFDLLDNLKKRHAFKDRKGSKMIRGVEGTTEAEALQRTKTLLAELLTAQVKQRPVIVLFYHSRETTFGMHEFNEEHESLAIQLGLTYCTETKIGDSGEPKYYIYKEHKWLGDEVRTTRTELHPYDSSTTIIDDTPENRHFLEGLYHALKQLQANLDKFTESPVALLGLINSNKNLLGANNESNDNLPARTGEGLQ